MTAKPSKMELVKQILKLRNNDFSIIAIQRNTGLARNTFRKYLDRFNGQSLKDIKLTELRELAYDLDSTQYKGERFNKLVIHFSIIETANSFFELL